MVTRVATSVKFASTFQVSFLLRLKLSIIICLKVIVVSNQSWTVLLIKHTFNESGREKLISTMEKWGLSLLFVIKI